MQDGRFPAAPGFLIGISLAGLFDGIFLHQILLAGIGWRKMRATETRAAR